MARVAIVTGGTRGIGEAISIALKDMGLTVAANYAGNEERAKAFTERTGIKSYKWDVSDYDACQEGVRQVEQELGPVDVLVNNAGITRDSTMRKMDHARWQEVIDTNLGGCFNMAKAVFDGMTSRGYGRIVNIGSINGQAGQYGQVNYAAAKSGIHGFTKALAQEGAKSGITVNAICPGYVKTPLIEMQIGDQAKARGISPERVVEDVILAAQPNKTFVEYQNLAGMLLYLVSDVGSAATGAALSVDGAWTAT